MNGSLRAMIKSAVVRLFCGLAAMALAVAGPATAQGFAGLGEGGQGFAVPQRGADFTFPPDHGAHPDFRIEWWYLTATLQDAQGTRYGVQWTLFRSALAPGGPHVWMGHFGLTTPDRHFSGEKLARGGLGQAGVQPDPFSAWIDDWQLSGPTLDSLILSAQTKEAGYDLSLQAQGPLVFHGDAGYSLKSSEGQASFYYSQPFYDVSGQISLPGGPVDVTGQAWLDREWSSQPLSSDQDGWDWFSLHLADGHRLMGFQLRGSQPYTSASWITPDGQLTAYADGALRLTPLAQSRVQGRDIPTRWRLELAAEGVDVEVRAINTDSWQQTLFPYWEGPVTATGTHSAEGFLEMTGYE